MYKVVLTDLAFVPQAELKNVGGVTYQRALNKLATFTFRVRLDNKEAPRLAAAEGYIKLYRDSSLIFFGPIIAAEEVAEKEVQTIGVTCADAGWAMTKRLAGKSVSGTMWNSVLGRATIAKTLIQYANEDTETGLRVPSGPNMFFDPSFVLGINGAVGTNATVTHNAGAGQHGTGYIVIDPAGLSMYEGVYWDIPGFEPGRQYTVSIYVRNPTTSVSYALRMDDGTGSITTGSSVSSGINSWVRLSATKTLSASATRLRVAVVTGATNTTVFHADSIQVEPAASASTFTDESGTSGSAITYKAGPFKPISDCVQELSRALDGFDWRINPVENWANGAVTTQKIGEFVPQTLIGTSKSNAVFEYGAGTRSNVLSYSKTRARDTQANFIYHVGPTDVLSDSDSTAITTWGRQEDALTLTLTDTAMRTGLLDDHIRVRANPRDIIRLTPHIDPGDTGRLPEPFVDYDIGDTIPVRFVHNNTVRFSGLVRVYGIKTTVEENTGFERVELTLEYEG